MANGPPVYIAITCVADEHSQITLCYTISCYRGVYHKDNVQLVHNQVKFSQQNELIQDRIRTFE